MGVEGRGRCKDEELEREKRAERERERKKKKKKHTCSIIAQVHELAWRRQRSSMESTSSERSCVEGRGRTWINLVESHCRFLVFFHSLEEKERKN